MGDSRTFFERYNHEQNEYGVNAHLPHDDSMIFVERIIGEIKKRGMRYHAVGHGWTCECLSFPSKGWNTAKDARITIKLSRAALKDEAKITASAAPKQRSITRDTGTTSLICGGYVVLGNGKRGGGFQ